MLKILLFLFVLSLETPPAAELKTHIWHMPKEMTNGDSTVYIDEENFKFQTESTNDDVKDAFSRYIPLIFYSDGENNSKGGLKQCIVNIKDENAKLIHGVDESYNLVVPKDDSPIIINANTQFGLYHALETLSQMIVYDYDEKTYVITNAPYNITDSPAFPVYYYYN